jgi:hypothetical protein
MGNVSQWSHEDGLIAVIVLAICIPLMLPAVANSGGKKGPIGEMYNTNRSFRPSEGRWLWSKKAAAQARRSWYLPRRPNSRR